MSKKLRRRKQDSGFTFSDLGNVQPRYRKAKSLSEDCIEAALAELKPVNPIVPVRPVIIEKYKLVSCERLYQGIPLLRVVATRSFGDVSEGDVGGCIQGEHNLSHNGDCWLSYDCVVMDKGRLQSSARMHGRSVLKGNGFLGGNAYMRDNTVLCGNAIVTGHVGLVGRLVVGGNLKLSGINIFRCQEELSEYLDESKRAYRKSVHENYR